MKNLKFLLVCMIVFLLTNHAYPQVVQYERKEKYTYCVGKYVVLQVDYAKKRFVYRVSCDSELTNGCISGYVEMYGVLHESKSNNRKYQEMEMEIYDWLYMDLYKHYPYYWCHIAQEEHIAEGNPRMYLMYSKKTATVTYGNIFEERYSKFYKVLPALFESNLSRCKVVGLDENMYGKKLYKSVVKDRENIINEDEIFLPYDDQVTRIYRYWPHPLITNE